MSSRSPDPQHGRGPRSQPAQQKIPAPQQSPNPLAFDDPTRRKTKQPTTAARSQHDRQVTWIRTRDIPTVLSGRVLVRGVDLHAALVRRAMRLPIGAAKTAAGAAKRLVANSTPQSAETQAPPRTRGRARARESRQQQGTEGMGI